MRMIEGISSPLPRARILRVSFLSGLLSVFLMACDKKQLVVAPPENNGPKILSLFADARANRVGDLINIQIVENARGYRQSKSNGAKKNTIGFDLKGDGTDDAGSSTLEGKLDLKTKNDYDANNAFEKKGNLMANVTAMVTEILPNGNLVVSGQQEITIDKGVQIISVSGIVRPDDIGANNSVISTRLASAKIKYRSKGDPDIHRYGILGWLYNLVF